MSADEGVIATHIADCVVLAIPEDLSGGGLDQVRATAQRCASDSMLRAMVFDCSALKYTDADEFRELMAVARLVTMMGVTPVVAGLNAGIIAYLVEVGAEPRQMPAFLDLADALQHLGLTARRQT